MKKEIWFCFYDVFYYSIEIFCFSCETARLSFYGEKRVNFFCYKMSDYPSIHEWMGLCFNGEKNRQKKIMAQNELPLFMITGKVFFSLFLLPKNFPLSLVLWFSGRSLIWNFYWMFFYLKEKTKIISRSNGRIEILKIIAGNFSGRKLSKKILAQNNIKLL